MFRSMKSRVLSGTALLVAAAVALGVTIAPMDDDETEAAANGVKIGTYDPEAVFRQYHGFGELVGVSQRLEQEFQQAQMQGNQQRQMEIQQEMQNAQVRIITRFQEEIERVMPDIAREKELKVVAIQVVYAAEEYAEPEDISDDLVEKLNEGAPQSEQPSDPFRPAPTPGGGVTPE